MKKKFIGVISMAMALCILASGCGEKSEKTVSGDITYPKDGSIYPMKCNDTLSVYTEIKTDGERIKHWKDAVGIDIEFVTAMSGNEETLSVIIASNDLPDIILADLFTQPGGIQKFANDGVIIDLTKYMDKYAPNLKAFFDKNELVNKISLSDNSKYYFFPCIRDGEILCSYRGPVIRKDWLEKYGIDKPQTIDDWYNMLKTFKENGATAPLNYDVETYERVGGILSAYGVVNTFYLDNGKVKYGFLEDGMREGLKTLQKWYSEGLIDENVVNGSTNLDANLLSGKTGATFATSGGQMGKYLKAAAEVDDSFDLVGVELPVLNKGDKQKFSDSTFPVSSANNGFITSQCENIELAMRFLDYGYSDKGHMLMNFGTEGVSYEMKDGYPTYTDLIMHNPDGKSVAAAMNEHIFANWAGPFAQDPAYIEQYNQLPQQKEALKLWGSKYDMTNTMPLVTFTEEESEKISSIMNNVNTCASENLFKFIMGIKSVDKDYDEFVKELKAFNIDEAINIYSTALKRYNKR